MKRRIALFRPALTTTSSFYSPNTTINPTPRLKPSFDVSSSSSCTLHILAQYPSQPISPFSSLPSYLSLTRILTTNSSSTHTENRNNDGHPLQDQTSEEETSDGWEEEDEGEPEVGDGGDGGGVVLGDVIWSKRALSIANEVLVEFGDGMKIFAFKTSPRGYIYVRLDKLSNDYGCPDMEEIEKYSCLYKKKLDEVGESGEIPDDLALEVSSPGAERLLKVPDDLDRFRNLPMMVNYMENNGKPVSVEKDGIFLLESIETESGHCVWKLADVKDNRDLAGKGRPLSRKQKDWRLKLPFDMVKRVMLYLEY